MVDTAARICSLLPSATEILFLLGLGDRVVAVTHECDYPPGALSKPHITSSVIDSAGMSAAEIDQAVRDSLADQSTIYQLDRHLLERLEPDLLLTQELCDVCAVGPPLVEQAVAALPNPPRVVSLEPHSLSEILDSIRVVGALAGVVERADLEVATLQARLDDVRSRVAGLPVVRVLTLEWVDPLFVGGHWVPDQVKVAGGIDVLGTSSKPSREVSWEDVVVAAPEVIIAMPCGFGLDRAERELARARLPAQWHELPAVKNGAVYVVDGSSYFNRPGPRVVDGVEILACILHPDVFPNGPRDGYRRFAPASASPVR
jgi:iron complex transport system substrate-binding protein